MKQQIVANEPAPHFSEPMQERLVPELDFAAACALAEGRHGDPFAWLGMHLVEQNGRSRLLLRAVLPGAAIVEVLDAKTGRKVAELTPVVGAEPLFSGFMGRRVKPFDYRLRISYPQAELVLDDPYRFDASLDEQACFLFNEGSLLKGWQLLGANWLECQGVKGVRFCVWAPNAKSVSLLGDFNHWDRRRHSMRRHPASGLWELFLPQVQGGEHYKFLLQTQDGSWLEKADPCARQMQGAPHNASIVPMADSDWQWQDSDWMAARAQSAWHRQAVSIYELHLGSWRRNGEGGFLSYAEVAELLVPYLQSHGFTHVEFMPLSEYPFDGSWGYQPVGLFAPSHRFGDPEGLKLLVDACHRAGIGVLLDWVAAHFPSDPHGLAHFDGTCLYEHEDPRRGRHPDWDTLIYNYGRKEVQSFLLSNACYWLEEFHFDGLRLDAVSSMLYLDYSREEGQWQANEYGGRENLEAIAFLQQLNTRLYHEYPGIIMIAEESTAWDGVSRDVAAGGLGFGFKWNMGWMHDTLDYLTKEPVHRSYHHGQLTFSLIYAYTEQFILSLSHDEVVHGKRALLEKIPGDDWQKFATLRAFYGFMWAHPGKKLLFMGGEFGQRREWQHDFSLDWHLLQYPSHQGLSDWVRDLNLCYRRQPSLWQCDSEPQGFRWLDCNDSQHSLLAFTRIDSDGNMVLVICNFTPCVREGYRLGLPEPGRYRELLNSDSAFYGGSNQGNAGGMEAEEIPWQGMPYSALIRVPPLASVYFALERG